MKQNKLNDLRTEQLRIKNQLLQKEKQLNEKIEFLEDNFGGMMLKSILPFSASQREQASSVFDKINDFVYKFIPGDHEEGKKSSLLKSLQMIVAGLVFRYLKKLF